MVAEPSLQTIPARRPRHIEDQALRIEARNVWFSYDGKSNVLKDVSLRVPTVGMTMLLGRSGSGKTTLLKLFKGLLEPQSGCVLPGLAFSANGSGAAGIAYIPQTLGLVRSLTALDNVLMGAFKRTGVVRSLAGSFCREATSEAKEILGRLGIAHKMDERVQRLSGGERQRVAIGRALMQKPSLILADEFVSQIDAITAEEILEMMSGIATRGTAILVTTHETDVVAEYADRLVVMSGMGTIVHESLAGSLSEREIKELLR